MVGADDSSLQALQVDRPEPVVILYNFYRRQFIAIIGLLPRQWKKSTINGVLSVLEFYRYRCSPTWPLFYYAVNWQPIIYRRSTKVSPKKSLSIMYGYRDMTRR